MAAYLRRLVLEHLCNCTDTDGRASIKFRILVFVNETHRIVVLEVAMHNSNSVISRCFETPL